MTDDLPAVLSERVGPPAGALLVKLGTMAEMLSVSVRWLRDSDCPTVRLRSSRPNGRPLLRYDVEAVRDWYRQFSTSKAA